MPSPLLELADAADAIAEDERAVARKARRMHGRRRLGASWRTIFDGDDKPTLVELLRRTRQRLNVATHRFVRVLAREMHDAGHSHAQIAGWFEVSRQRITKLLGRDRA